MAQHKGTSMDTLRHFKGESALAMINRKVVVASSSSSATEAQSVPSLFAISRVLSSGNPFGLQRTRPPRSYLPHQL